MRTLSVSRATVREVVRGHHTFKYKRGIQPSPKLGAWVEVLTADNWSLDPPANRDILDVG